MASNDRQFIQHIGRYIPRLNWCMDEFNGNPDYNEDLTYELMKTLRDELLEGFGRMEQGQFMWSEPFTDENVKVR